MPTPTFTILLLFLSISCSMPRAAPQNEQLPASQADLAFAEMKSYVGSWERAGISREDFHVRFSLTANETVLLETWLRGNQAHSLTVYHLDGERLLSTHYCPQGNQPRLAYVPHLSNHAMTFDYVDGTHIEASGNEYQTRSSFALSESGNSMVRGEVYSNAEEDFASSITLHRFE